MYKSCVGTGTLPDCSDTAIHHHTSVVLPVLTFVCVQSAVAVVTDSFLVGTGVGFTGCIL